MKHLFLFFIVFFSAFSLHAGQIIYPQLNTIVNQLFKHYDVEESTSERKLQFEKKPAGWFVVWADGTKVPATVLQEELFWSSKSDKFLELQLFKKGETLNATEKEKIFLADAEAYDCSRDAYYGYVGWDRDVINAFGSAKNLNDTLLESLGRAYSNYAYGFTDHRFSYHILWKDLDEKTKLDSFIQYEKSELKVYDQLRKQNPQYEMLVGNSNTKYSDEVMAFYDDLFLYGKEDIVKPYFHEELYDPMLLMSASTYLSECAPDAILFTNGDNDTFPLEYLQFAKGFRTDVTVLNLSIMNLSSTLVQASKGKGKALPVKFSYDIDRYAQEESTYFEEENFEGEPISYENFLSKSYLQHIHPENGKSDYSYYNFPQCTIQFPTALPFFKEFPNPVDDQMASIVINKTYLYRNEFAELDIIMSNLNERPIYFAIGTINSNIEINDYLFSEGIVKRFFPLKMKDGNTTLMSGDNVLKDVSYSNLMKINFNYSPSIDKYAGELFATNFKVQYVLLAYSMSSQEPEKAVRLLDHCDSLFPLTQWNCDVVWAYGVQTYYECQQKEKGDRIANQLLDDFEKKMQDKKTPIDEDEKTQFNAAATLIKSTADDFSRTAVSDKAEKFLQKYK